MINIVLCGGSGTRLWPLSRSLFPKQFIDLLGDQSLFRQTVARNLPLCADRIIVCNAEHYFLAEDQLETADIGDSRYLLEPAGRNTAPAIALACLNVPPEEVVLVTPSDHLIQNQTAYRQAVETAQAEAEAGFLVTMGVPPAAAETGFGYIESETADDKQAALKVLRFHEKPDQNTAQRYLSQKNYYWNVGIFCFRAGVFLAELQRHAPQIYKAALAANRSAKRKDALIRIAQQAMINIPENSIDYAVLEHSDKVKVVPAHFDWSDIGSFDALDRQLPKTDCQNTVCTRHIALNSHNNLIHASTERLIATIDIDDCLIIDSGDALLLAKKGSAQKVKELMPLLKKEHAALLQSHRTTYRPWGSYTVLEDVPGYKLKRIEVKPGKRLSLQKHFHRNEHWIVVSGTATVTVGEQKYPLCPNESTYIKMGEIHRLENEGKIPVVLIEAQVGEYTGEDDIVRLEDDFCRTPETGGD